MVTVVLFPIESAPTINVAPHFTQIVELFQDAAPPKVVVPAQIINEPPEEVAVRV